MEPGNVEGVRISRFVPSTASALACFPTSYETPGEDRDAVGRCLDGLALAIFMVHGDLYCADLNAAARALAFRADGVTLRQHRLTTVEPHAMKPFRAAIETATARAYPEATSLIIPRPTPLQPYIATVSPLPTAAGPSLAMIVLCDPKSANESAGPKLRQVFGLTEAEASLAVALADGMSPDEIADLRGVSLSTVRTQLRAVSSKMGCSRLSQVAAVVAGLPPTSAARLVS